MYEISYNIWKVIPQFNIIELWNNILSKWKIIAGRFIIQCFLSQNFDLLMGFLICCVVEENETSTNIVWYLYSFRALFVLYKALLDKLILAYWFVLLLDEYGDTPQEIRVSYMQLLGILCLKVQTVMQLLYQYNINVLLVIPFNKCLYYFL